MEQLLILRDLAVIFGASLVVVLVFHRMRLPALPGFIVAGVLLGPNALGFIPDVHRVEGLAAGDELAIVGQPHQLRAARDLLIGQPPEPGQASQG